MMSPHCFCSLARLGNRLSVNVTAWRLPFAKRVSVCVAAATTDGSDSKPAKVFKRAPTPFNLYYSDQYAAMRARLTSAGKAAGLAQCNVALREAWAGLPAASKAPYEVQAAKIKEDMAAQK
jgi:hypothetical protein